MTDCDVLVIGGGHAGLEAAAAAARLGARTALVTLDPRAIGRLSCNPAIGGIGKGHLVREIHALGGLMGDLADRTGIQFRLLNTSRGPAVRGPRAQVDRNLYPLEAQRLLAGLAVEVLSDEVLGLVSERLPDGRLHCIGALLSGAGSLRAGAVVLSSGTFLGGVLHVGREQVPGGRRGEAAATALSASLRELGLPLGRFKTGTPPRLLAGSIDWERTVLLPGDKRPTFFCPETRSPSLSQVDCHVVRTVPEAHGIILAALPDSPLAAGRITGRGPRYCPSFEEKVCRFKDRDSHVLILEPEALDSNEIYLNGASTSLPAEAQRRFLRAIPALERVEVTQYGHAVEYDYVSPGEVTLSLESRRVAGLHLAGQVLGTTGYEEAAALGLMAGANAALAALGGAPFILARHEAYVGVMVDDLVMRGLDEPYRIFTSRAEHRLLLGIDTADLRLASRAGDIGLVPGSAGMAARDRAGRLERARGLLADVGFAGGGSLAEACRRPETDLQGLAAQVPAAALECLGAGSYEREDLLRQAAETLRYEPYLRRQASAINRLDALAERRIPLGMDWTGVSGLSTEVKERLATIRPETLGQAGRLPGLTPAALQIVAAYVVRAQAGVSVPRGTLRDGEAS